MRKVKSITALKKGLTLVGATLTLSMTLFAGQAAASAGCNAMNYTIGNGVYGSSQVQPIMSSLSPGDIINFTHTGTQNYWLLAAYDQTLSTGNQWGYTPLFYYKPPYVPISSYVITSADISRVGVLVMMSQGGNAADTVTVSCGSPNSPAKDFAAAEDVIRAVITNDATRSLTSTLNANENMVREARERLIASQQEGEDAVSRDNVPFDIDGTFNLDGSRLSTKGTFFEQRGTADGAGRRLFFGDFDVQHDGDTNSTTATITARMAWEQMYTDSTMLGYFVGGELAHSNIKGSFEGEQDRLGVSFGGYAVHQLDEQVFVDGFITVGAGRNNLEIADATLDLTSDYTTRTATMGAAVSGVYEYGQYDFHPELAFSYGKTWIGDVGFTGVAYGLTNNTLSLDAGDVSIANLTLRPEIVWALDAETVADSNTQLSFAPRFICQRTSAAATTQDCGAGAEIGLSSTSEDGLSSANIRLVMDRVGNSNRSSFALNFERSF